MRINAPHKDAIEVRSIGKMGRVLLRLYDDDLGIVVVRPGSKAGLNGINKPCWRRVFRGTNAEATRLANVLGPIIDGYARGCGIRVQKSHAEDNANGG